MTVEVKAAQLSGARQLLQAKVDAYLTNPTLREHTNVVSGMAIYEAVVAEHDAQKRRTHATYLQQIGRAKREPLGITRRGVLPSPGGDHEDSDS